QPVRHPRSRILSSLRLTWAPLLPLFTRLQLIPLLPSTLVRAQTMITPARSPEVIHCFLPLITYSLPSRRAVVRSAAASEPAFGSERPKLAATKRPEVISGR